MPYDEADETDPTMLVGVELPGTEESIREMAYTFAEEYLSLGYSEEDAMRLFRHRSFSGPRHALDRLGEEEVRRIVHECAGVWGRVRVVVEDAGADAPVPLRVPKRSGG